MAVENLQFPDVTQAYLAAREAGLAYTPPPGYEVYVDLVFGSPEGFATIDGRRYSSLEAVPKGEEARPVLPVLTRARLIPTP